MLSLAPVLSLTICSLFSTTLSQNRNCECAAGQRFKSCDATGFVTCEECPLQSFISQDVHQLSDCSPCRTMCPEGMVSQEECTPRSDLKCSCPEGFYQTATGCRKCSYCSLGYGVARACGDEGDTICEREKCPTDTYQDNNHNYKFICQPCSATCPIHMVLGRCSSDHNTLCMDSIGAVLSSRSVEQELAAPESDPWTQIGLIPVYVSVLVLVIVSVSAYAAYRKYRLSISSHYQPVKQPATTRSNGHGTTGTELLPAAQPTQQQQHSNTASSTPPHQQSRRSRQEARSRQQRDTVTTAPPGAPSAPRVPTSQSQVPTDVVIV